MKKTIRVTVVGDGGIGKTCMLIAYKDKTFDENSYVPTVFDVYSMTVPINNQDYTIVLYDTAGQEEFEKLRKLAYNNIDVFIVCYAINERTSFENVKTLWCRELQHCCPHAKIILAGTKSDSPHREVSQEEGLRLQRQIKADGFIENSAKMRRNIEETFALALSAVVRTPPRKRSTNVTCNVL